MSYIKPYELSIWEDSIEENIPKEKRICVIASNTMTSPAQAFEILFSRKTNGEKELSFSLYANYYDQETESFVTNPYLKLLTNERKIKLCQIKNKKKHWYDFIIKEISEDSKTQKYTYVAKDLFIQELSKSGFELEFSKEQQNNTDTAKELSKKILAGTGWTIEDGDSLLEYTEEPVYRAKLSKTISYQNMRKSEVGEISQDAYIYIPYSEVQNKSNPCQILYYDGDNQEEAYVRKDEDNVLLKKLYQNLLIQEEAYSSFVDKKSLKLMTDCRGGKLVRSLKTIYDKKLETYVTEFQKLNSEAQSLETFYGFTKTEYITPEFVQDLVDSGEKFTSETGWHSTDTGKVDLVFSRAVNEWKEDNIESVESYIQVSSKHKVNAPFSIMNTGFFSNRSLIGSLVTGQFYNLELQLELETEEAIQYRFFVSDYEIVDGIYTPISGTEYFDSGFDSSNNLPGPSEYDCLRTISEKDMKSSKIGMFLEFKSNTNKTLKNVKIKKFSFYKQVFDEDGNSISPGEVPKSNLQSQKLVKTKYYYFPKDAEYSSLEDLVFSYEDYAPWSEAKPVYYEGCEKRRTITAKESNRFNLLQKICETFECWLKINVAHNDDGTIDFKTIGFYEYVGKENHAGFKYGINLDSIKRKIDSNQIVTKMIVKDNANEFAKNGFCSIARAPSNPGGTQVLYNFDYYVAQDILTAEAVSKALYNFDGNPENMGEWGIYSQTKYYSDLLAPLNEQQVALSKNIIQYNSEVQYQQARLEGIQTTLATEQDSLEKTTKYTYRDFLAGIDGTNDWKNSDDVKGYMTKIFHLKKEEEDASDKLEEAQKNLDAVKKQYDNNAVIIQGYISDRRSKEEDFNKKYYRFIQEGSWISEEYADDELYYLDALATGFTSSRPKITYTINVFDLKDIEGYENYQFDVGDKTFVEDPEFFGWKKENGLKRPFREEVIVNEIIEGIDDIKKNSIKVQNYKTQFDDLFQRIAAETESLQYNTGRYERSAKAVESNGALSHKALQQAVNENGLAISNAGAQTVTCDEQGIITTDKTSPNKKVRIIGGGIYVSQDGGETWRTGITGSGINADVITTGQLNAGEINIMTGKVASHRWDDKGITAYKTAYDTSTGNITSVDNASFVRFDEFGLYGIQGMANFNAREMDENSDTGIAKIEKNATFSLTQKGVTIGGTNGLRLTDNGLTIGGNDAFKATEDGVQIGGENGFIATGNSLKIGDFFKIDEETQVASISGWVLKEGYFGNSDSNPTFVLAPKGREGTINNITGSFVISSPNFGVTKEGIVVADNAEITGKVRLKNGSSIGELKTDSNSIYIGKWDITNRNPPTAFMSSGTLNREYKIGGHEASNWVFGAGDKFGVTTDGALYATKGKIGGWQMVQISVSGNKPYHGNALWSGESTEVGYILEGVYLTPLGCYRQKSGQSNDTYYKSWADIIDGIPIGAGLVKREGEQ